MKDQCIYLAVLLPIDLVSGSENMDYTLNELQKNNNMPLVPKTKQNCLLAPFCCYTCREMTFPTATPTHKILGDSP